MDILAIIRRSISAAVATALLLVGSAYLVVSTTLLTTTGLNSISQQANVAEIVGRNLVLPHLINQAETSDYSHLLTKETITKAYNQAVPDSALEPKLDPAIEATRAWLDSKSSSIDFVIDTSDISKDFKDSLTTEVSKNLAKLPTCNYDNTLSDAEYARCKSPYIATSEIKETITDNLDSNPALQLSSITTETFSIPEATLKLTRNIPDYINMLYALSLLTTGVAAIIILRLIIRHKLNGFITVGCICLALAGILFIASLLIVPLAANLEVQKFIQDLATATAESFKAQLQRQAISLGGIGVITISLFGLLKFTLFKFKSRSS